jgi:hypothetical protein
VWSGISLLTFGGMGKIHIFDKTVIKHGLLFIDRLNVNQNLDSKITNVVNL